MRFGHDNVALFVLDSCRWDTFITANTPNMDKIGKVRAVHSVACCTVPSMISYMFGFPPIGITRMLPGIKISEWAPETYHEKGYQTAWYSCNNHTALLDLRLSGGFQKHWDSYNWNYDDHGDGSILIIEDFRKLRIIKPLFATFLLMETHYPYSWIDLSGNKHRVTPCPRKMDEMFRAQVNAIEHIDRLMPFFFEVLERIGIPTQVIITSDHGEIFGPNTYGHGPEMVPFCDELYRIPYIEGRLGRDGDRVQ